MMFSQFATPMAGQPDLQRPGVAVVRMQQGMRVERFFDPVYSVTSPLEWNEFSAVIDELNAVVNARLPVWKRMMPTIMIAIGFLTFVVGGFLMVSTSGFGGPNPFSLLVIGLGFFMFAGGPVTSKCVLGRASYQAISDVRRKLSDLNARYASRNIDFQLHEAGHLEFFYRTCNDHGMNHSHREARFVTDYTLVVQAVGATGERQVPSPEVLAAQALRDPSAPPQPQSVP